MSPPEKGGGVHPRGPLWCQDLSGLSINQQGRKAEPMRQLLLRKPGVLSPARSRGSDQRRFLSQTSLQPPKFIDKQPLQTLARPGFGAPSSGAISGCNELEIIAASGTQLTLSCPGPAGAFASHKSNSLLPSPGFLRKLQFLFLLKVSL